MSATTSNSPAITKKTGLLFRSTTIMITDDSAPITGKKLWIGRPLTCPSEIVGGAAMISASAGLMGRVIRVGRWTSRKVMAAHLLWQAPAGCHRIAVRPAAGSSAVPPQPSERCRAGYRRAEFGWAAGGWQRGGRRLAVRRREW